MHRGFFGESRSGFNRVPTAVDLSCQPEFQKKVKDALKVVTLTEVAALFILIPLFSIGHTRPWMVKWYIENRGGITGAIPAILSIISFACGILLYMTAVWWAHRRIEETGIPVWKQTLPFLARHFTIQHCRKEYLSRNPDLLTVLPPSCYELQERPIEMYPMGQQDRRLEVYPMGQQERRPIILPRWSRLEPPAEMPAPPPYTQEARSPPPSYDAS